MLQQGGNAIDAAVATGLTLGTVEPWMSGIGGGGCMTIYLAATRSVKVIEFGMRAPLQTQADDYPLARAGTNTADSFNWPKVTGDVNIHGPLSIGVPGHIKGMACALDTFGTWSWQDVIEPACQEAALGLPIDWYSAQKINQSARGLAIYPETSRVYLADGLPPAADPEGLLGRLPLGNLDQTYRHLQVKGPESYYQGELADSLVADLQQAGSRITREDFTDYTLTMDEPLSTAYRDARLFVTGQLTAGPSIIRALNQLEGMYQPQGKTPDATAYRCYATALLSAYEHRLAHLGEGADRQSGNTSHLCVADKAGNVVSLTQTIMSAFGSRIMLPGSGVLMNNSMMSFDPRPDGPNSPGGGRRPLSNMCPVILQTADGSTIAIGGCGGRRILPAVFQLASFLVDYDMTLQDAAHQARLDVSGTNLITFMEQLDPGILAELVAAFKETAIRPNGVNPNLFALPQIVARTAAGKMSGGCFIPSPHAKVSAVSDL